MKISEFATIAPGTQLFEVHKRKGKPYLGDRRAYFVSVRDRQIVLSFDGDLVRTHSHFAYPPNTWTLFGSPAYLEAKANTEAREREFATEEAKMTEIDASLAGARAKYGRRVPTVTNLVGTEITIPWDKLEAVLDVLTRKPA